MADKKERELVNPKWLLRRISETLPPSLPEELVNMIIALYAHSNDWITKEDAERGRFKFSVTAPFSQLAKYTRLTDKGAKRRCERLRDDWGIVAWKISANRNHGNDFSISWEAATPKETVHASSEVPEGCTTGAASGGVLETRGGVPRSQGGVLEGSGGVPARTPSVLSGLSGLSVETIAIADISQDTEQETAGETPATPMWSSKFVSSSEHDSADPISAFREPVSFSPASTDDSAALPSWETEPARCLANHLFCFLSVHADVEVLQGWEKFWTEDFQDALDSGWSVEDVIRAIQASQVGRAREFYKRGASIVAQLDLLVTYGRKLQERGLLVEVECKNCHGLFVGDDAFEHIFACYYRNRPADPEDVAEEEAMYAAEEMASEGYIREHPDIATCYPWADVPAQMPEPAGEPIPY